MQTSRRVAVIVGSLRKASYNRLMALALALAKMAAPDLESDLIEIGNLPLYNEDVEAALVHGGGGSAAAIPLQLRHAVQSSTLPVATASRERITVFATGRPMKQDCDSAAI
jgi:NAD(P)H-dependent FMN reductase